MCLGNLSEKSQCLCFPGPYVWQLKEKTGLSLLFPLWQGGIVCLHHPTGVPGCSTTCPEQVWSALGRRVLPSTTDIPEPYTSDLTLRPLGMLVQYNQS